MCSNLSFQCVCVCVCVLGGGMHPPPPSSSPKLAGCPKIQLNYLFLETVLNPTG